MSEPASEAPATEPEQREPEEEKEVRPRYRLALALFALTCVSTTYVGTIAERSLAGAFRFSVPLMAILLAHEFGHYIAARIHKVPASLPYFVPFPWSPMGTMGAVILMRGRIRNRNALLDIGAAGPLAGLTVALPVLAYGILESRVTQPPTFAGGYVQEGHSLLYLLMLRLLKGELPEGYDIMLSPTAFAGWAGLFVTMLNLIPALQLDGGHVAYALLGDRYHAMSRALRRGLLPFAIAVGLFYGLRAYADGARGDALLGQLAPASQWLFWWLILSFMGRGAGPEEHPPTDPSVLSPVRRVIACATLALFVLLFMPAWMRTVPGPSG